MLALESIFIEKHNRKGLSEKLDAVEGRENKISICSYRKYVFFNMGKHYANFYFSKTYKNDGNCKQQIEIMRGREKELGEREGQKRTGELRIREQED